MSIFDNIKAEVAKAEAGFAKDEQWVVNEIATGWKALQTAEQAIAVDAVKVFTWISAHHQDILNLFKGVLSDLTVIGTVIPGAQPVAIATTAIDAATAAVDVLAKGIQQGSTPLSTIANAYHAVKDAQNAVNGVLKQGTTKPASAPAS